MSETDDPRADEERREHAAIVQAEQWSPSALLEVVDSPLATSTYPVRVRTDTGPAMMKTLGNPEGPHALAREWIGTRAAQLLGLPTFDLAILELDEPATHLAREAGAKHVKPGPAIFARYEDGATWDGSAAMLDEVANAEACTRLVVLDSWIRNHDRYLNHRGERRENYDNVWVSLESEPPLLKAIDHTHCFRGLGLHSRRIGHIDQVKDATVYGLFPAFAPLLDSDVLEEALESALASVETLCQTVRSLPRAWDVDTSAREAICRFLRDRARFLIRYLPSELGETPGLLSLD